MAEEFERLVEGCRRKFPGLGVCCHGRCGKSVDVEVERLDALRQLASKFRAAIMRIEPGSLSIASEEAPLGTSDLLSLLLARFLYENGFVETEFIRGGLGAATHYWLEIEGFVVDIAADRFIEVKSLRLPIGPKSLGDELLLTAPAGVVVANNSAWHKQFNWHFRKRVDTMEHNPETQQRLDLSYQRIILEINRT